MTPAGMLPMAPLCLFAALLATRAAAEGSCDAPEPPETHGQVLLQRRTAVNAVVSPAEEDAADGEEGPADGAAAGAASPAERPRGGQGSNRTEASLSGASGGACVDTPGWQNWFYTCADYESQGLCLGGAAVPGYEWAFGEIWNSPEDSCCACGKGQAATCATHPCPYGYNARPEQSSSTSPSDATCCEATCAGHVYHEECPEGYEPDWDQATSTDVSDSNCCKPRTTTTTEPPYDGPGKARHVRILPQSWHGSIAMRAAVLVGEDLEVVDPPEEVRSYSSVKPLNNQYCHDGAEGHPGSNYGRSKVTQCCRHSWMAKHNRAGEWMQIDLGKNRDVRGVVVTGRPKSGCPHRDPLFVKRVKVSTATSEDPDTWEMRDGGRDWNTFGSADRGTVRIVFGEAETTTATPRTTFLLIKAGVECRSSDVNMGLQPSLQACADKVRDEGGRFFIYGTGHKENRCWSENTASAACSEGWESDAYDFYALEDGTGTSTPPPTPPTTGAPSEPWATLVEHICPGHLSEKQGLSDADAMLKAHNYLRCLHGHAALAWSTAVAANAQVPANQSCAADRLIHSESYAMTPPAGENLALGGLSPDGASAAWYNELITPGYTAGVWGDEAISSGVGHFTALIWKDTTELGCASCVSGQGRKVWACQYAGEAPNSGDQAKWVGNVPQSNLLQATPESCCAQTYG